MFLVDKFQQFYVELLRLRDRVTEGTWVVVDGELAPSGDDANAETAPSAVWHKLHSLLKRQSSEAQREGGDFGVEVYRRAQYAMAALADEIFLHLEWAGRDAWREHLLESKLFGSHRAGEELFERIEQLLLNRDAVFTELARVYLTTLALGFEGKYRGNPEAPQDIEAYRRRLHRFIFNHEPLAVRGHDELVPQAYASTLDEARATRLPRVRKWGWTIAFIVAAWLLVGEILWRDATNDIKPYITKAMSHSEAGH
jgi:type VI secretion system protein ImpK